MQARHAAGGHNIQTAQKLQNTPQSRQTQHFNMKNSHITQNYFSTSQAAKMLGLSVGTVQRMVENGAFKAFVTQGGHRRILSSSLDQYCKKQGFPNPSSSTEPPLICILHDSEHRPADLQQLGQWEQVKVITHPLDLMGIHQQIEAFFIDARIPWLHNAPLGLQDSLMQNAHLVVYNSDKLPPDSPLRLAKHLKLFQGNINTDWVDGYLLGREHMSDTPSPSPIRQ